MMAGFHASGDISDGGFSCGNLVDSRYDEHSLGYCEVFLLLHENPTILVGLPGVANLAFSCTPLGR